MKLVQTYWHESGLQISLKIKLRSEAKAKFFSRKIAKRSEAKIFFVCAKRIIFQNCEKMRKIAKLRKFFSSFEKSSSSFYNFNNLYKCNIFDVKSLYRLFGHLFENTGKLNEAWFTQKNFQKKTFILAAILGKPTKLSKGYQNLSGNPK